MNIVDSPAPKRPRGRPRSATKRQVIDKLLEAAELFLRDHSHVDLTERKIAEAAGVDDAMINYYFGGKDGLLFNVLVHQNNEIEKKLRALDTIDPGSPSVTRNIFEILIDAYYDKPWITKYAASEFTRNGSAFYELFVKKYGTQGIMLVYLRRLINQLMERGIYHRRVNVEYVAKSMLFIVSAPMIFTQRSGDGTPAFEEFTNDCWINHVADMFDCYLRVTKAKDAIPPISPRRP